MRLLRPGSDPNGPARGQGVGQSVPYLTRRQFFGAGAAGASALLAGCGNRPRNQETSRLDIPFDLDEVTVTELSSGMIDGRWSAETITLRYLERIEALDRQGPTLGAIIRTNPDALATARALDVERRAGRVRSDLHGIPVLVKDNIDTTGPMPTTAGSLALQDWFPPTDAFVVARLRAVGAVVLAKANLSEWANFRDLDSTSGWSAVGGQCRNPYMLQMNPCGSSSGSAVAVSANLAPLAIGTETDGSIICPASRNGVVGIKPTVGRISRSGIIPISSSQDTAGPIARTVTDAARLYELMAGPDPSDPATTLAPSAEISPIVLDPDALDGVRLGVARNFRMDAAVWERFESVLAVFRDAGAVVVDPAPVPNTDRLGESEFRVLLYEFREGLNRYLDRLPVGSPARSLDELVAFNEAQREQEMPYFGQSILLAALQEDNRNEAAYRASLEWNRRFARTEGIDAVMNALNLDALICPSGGLAWQTNYTTGDRSSGSAAGPAAVAGYPHITVPLGLERGLPLGISFFGRAWSEPALIRFAFAFEQQTRLREFPHFLEAAL